MADSSKYSGGGGRLLNPWVLHIQKMGLELKCPLCLNLFHQPTLFPCDHIFCSSCTPRSTELGSECPICKAPYVDEDLRPAPYMENMVTIYRSLDVSFGNMFQPVTSDATRVSEQCLVSVHTTVGGMLSKEPVQTAVDGNLSNGHSIFSLTANKRIHVSSSHSLEDGVVKNEKTNVCYVPRDGKVGKFENADNGGIEHSGDGNLTLTPSSSLVRAVGLVECGTATVELNQVVAQTSPGCPPPYGDTKGSDDDSSDLGNERIRDKYLGKRPAEQDFDSKAKLVMPGTQDHERDLKRQRKLNYVPAAEISNCEMQIKPVVCSGAQGPIISEDLVANKTICGFCQSSSLSEATGEMLHYIRGNPVEGQKANNPNAIHVHSKCIEWAPQVYYVGETVKNLEKELARGAKLKCFKCGLKGAALGCYAKSCRRTYHVPCALEADCRWETENFLMLCPAHSKLKFPIEKKSRNQALESQLLPTQITPRQSNSCGGLLNGKKQLVLCGSALSSEEKHLMLEFARISGVAVSKFWRPDVTHVIAATDADGACTRTLKVLSAILHGRWVLTIDWLKASLEAKHPVDEEPYEVSHDNHDSWNGPTAGRLRALSNAPKLFDGLKFYLTGDFVPGYKEDLQNLVSGGGGVILNSKEDLVACSRSDQGAPSSILIVYNIDPPKGCKLGEEVSALWERLNHAEDLAAKIGSRVIGHTWLLESIASCTLQPVVS